MSEGNINKKEILSKVVFIGPDYKYPNGGIAKLLESYSKEFSPFNFIPTMRAPQNYKESKLKTVYRFLQSLPITFKYALSPKIKIVHINPAIGISFYRKLFYLIFFKLFCKKIVLHLHSGNFIDFYNQNPKLVSFTLKNSDFVITIANIWESFLKYKKYDNVITIGNPINFPREIKNQGEIKNLRKFKNLSILFLGLISEKKGIWDIIEIINENKQYFKDRVKFIIGGRGETEKLINLINNYDLKDIVEFVGWIDDTKKPYYLKEASIYLQPSYLEGLGIAILEAMSYKLPVIATKTGGIPEIVHDNKSGLLSVPGDKESLFNNIKKLIENPDLRKEMGEEGYKIAQNYSMEKIKPQLLNLYSSLLKK